MTATTVKQMPKSTVELEITIPWSDIKSTYDQILTQVSKDAEISGFRKGKAPKKIIEDKADKNKLYEEVIRKIIPKAYSDAVKEHQLNPIISPKIEIIKAKIGGDWGVKAIISLKPKINLKNYKEKIKIIKAAKVKLWTPGQDKEAVQKKLDLEEIIKTVIEEVEIELSDELVNEEANRLLSDLIDRTRQLGLTMEQYLISKGKSREQLRAEYADEAKKNLTLEFALMEIAEAENITVNQTDIDNLLNNIKDEKEKEKLKSNSYYLAHLLRQQKTIDFINNL